MRSYDPDAGQILLDQIDLRDYVLADLRSQFALVPFSTSLWENIAYRNPRAMPAKVKQAAYDANIHEFIQALPEAIEPRWGNAG